VGILDNLEAYLEHDNQSAQLELNFDEEQDLGDMEEDEELIELDRDSLLGAAVNTLSLATDYANSKNDYNALARISDRWLKAAMVLEGMGKQETKKYPLGFQALDSEDDDEGDN
jgi:hypothetical protein